MLREAARQHRDDGQSPADESRPSADRVCQPRKGDMEDSVDNLVAEEDGEEQNGEENDDEEGGDGTARPSRATKRRRFYHVQ